MYAEDAADRTIFDELGLANAEELRLKARFAHSIASVVRQAVLDQDEVAKELSLNSVGMQQLLSGIVSDVPLETLRDYAVIAVAMALRSSQQEPYFVGLSARLAAASASAVPPT